MSLFTLARTMATLETAPDSDRGTEKVALLFLFLLEREKPSSVVFFLKLKTWAKYLSFIKLLKMNDF